MKEIEVFKKNLPYIGILLVGGGIIRTNIYYSFFGININSYLRFSETLILFTYDYILITFFAIVIFFLHTRRLVNEDTVKKEKTARRLEKIVLKIIALLLILTLIFSCIIFLFLSFMLIFYDINNKVFLIFFGYISLIIFIVFIYRDVSVRNKAYIYFSIAFSYCIYSSLTMGIITKECGRRYVVDAYLEKNTIFLTDEYYFIRKTEDYVFFYNKIENTSSLIPVNEIKKFIHRRNKNYEGPDFIEEIKLNFDALR